MKIFFSIICALFCVALAEISLERERRQSGLNGADVDDYADRQIYRRNRRAIIKPFGTPKFIYQIDAGQNFGPAGNLARFDGKYRYTGTPQIGTGTINGPRPNPQRSVTNGLNNNNNVEIPHRRFNSPLDSAMTTSLTNKPLGTPQFSYQIDAAGNSGRNFGAAGNAGAGVRVFENGPHSVGLGVGASRDLVRFEGKTYTGTPQVGAGVGYQNRDFSAAFGAGRPINGPGRNTHYGLNFGYRFKRSVTDGLNNNNNVEIPHRGFDSPLDSAMDSSLTPQFSYQIDAAGENAREFGASGSVGGGVRVWESGPHSVGVGVAASGGVQRADGMTAIGTPQVGAAVGYQNGAFSATLGAERPINGPGRNTQVGAAVGYQNGPYSVSAGMGGLLGAYNQFLLNLGYRFKRAAPAADYTAEDVDIGRTAED